MAVPRFLRTDGGEVLLNVKVQPRASRNEIGDALGNELKIKIAAPPVESAANEALVKFLASRFALPKSAVRLVRGATSRHKVIAIRGLSADTITALLQR